MVCETSHSGTAAQRSAYIRDGYADLGAREFARGVLWFDHPDSQGEWRLGLADWGEETLEVRRFANSPRFNYRYGA
jgi:hypothetical protein